MSAPTPPRGPKRPAPFSLRLTFEERRKLEQQAAGMPIAAYVKQQVFGPGAVARSPRGKAPVKDHQVLAQLLAQLGASRMPQNLNQLARAANRGSLPVNEETERYLVRACEDIAAMRWMLMKGLGMLIDDDQRPAETVTQQFTRASARPSRNGVSAPRREP